MAGITFTEGSGLQDSIFGKSQAPIRMFLEKRGEAFEQQSMLKRKKTIEAWLQTFNPLQIKIGFKCMTRACRRYIAYTAVTGSFHLHPLSKKKKKC